MQCTLIVTCEGPNPDFDRTQPIGPDNLRDRQRPIGTVVDHPDAWRLCLPDARDIVRAEPADDECRERVEIARQKRDATLSRLTAKQRAKREELKSKLPTLEADGTNGPSPATTEETTKRRRKSGQ